MAHVLDEMVLDVEDEDRLDGEVLERLGFLGLFGVMILDEKYALG